MTRPVLPYAGTSGWSGSDTSRERAVTRDRNGTTARNQKTVIDLLFDCAYSGITWKELSYITGWHHGTASGVLSVLHKAEMIYRLQEKRNRCAVYVLGTYIDGRKLAVTRIKTCKHCGGEL